MTPDSSDPDPPSPLPPEPEPLLRRVRHVLVGPPRSLADQSLFHRMSLIAFLAWVGLGADGLSSSSYGPEEAFRTLGAHAYLAVPLAAIMAFTIFVISSAYRRIIELFPHGGGGYMVATKLLGRRTGVLSGAALLVDYVLTITVSIAASGDALMSFLPPEWQVWKLPAEALMIVGLTLLNIRGIRESVLTLTPIFIVFVVTHVVLIVGGVIAKAPHFPVMARDLGTGFQGGLSALGVGGLLLVLARAYSLGGGTYTGIEAVSNGLPIMREPRVKTGKRTMVYMAVSLAFTASGLLLCYLLWEIVPAPGKTLNAVLVERLVQGFPLGVVFVILTLLAEGALLLVAAQAGFLDGPRVLANMAVDSWVPRHFASLSDRLTTQNGIVLMGVASLAALFYTRGAVSHLVVMYSINVFLTFLLSMLGMALWHVRGARKRPRRIRQAALFVIGSLLCATILGVTVVEKFRAGGWITLAVTCAIVLACFRIRRHYGRVQIALERLYATLGQLPPNPEEGPPATLEPNQPTAVVLVGGYGGLGIHTTLNAFRSFPGHFRNLVFVSVGVVDSGQFKGKGAVQSLRASTEEALRNYVDLARRLGVPATYRTSVGTDVVEEAERLCLAVLKEFPRSTFFAGKVIFRRDRWYERLLHNETAYSLQKRLQWAGHTMVILPARV